MRDLMPSNPLKRLYESERWWPLTIKIFAATFWTCVFGFIWKWDLNWPLVASVWAVLLWVWIWGKSDDEPGEDLAVWQNRVLAAGLVASVYGLSGSEAWAAPVATLTGVLFVYSIYRRKRKVH